MASVLKFMIQNHPVLSAVAPMYNEPEISLIITEELKILWEKTQLFQARAFYGSFLKHFAWRVSKIECFQKNFSEAMNHRNSYGLWST